MPIRRSRRLQRSHGSAAQENGGDPLAQAGSGPPNLTEGAESASQTSVNDTGQTLTESPSLNPPSGVDTGPAAPSPTSGNDQHAINMAVAGGSSQQRRHVVMAPPTVNPVSHGISGTSGSPPSQQNLLPVYSLNFQPPSRGGTNLSFLEATPVPTRRRAVQQYQPFHTHAGGTGGYSGGRTPIPAEAASGIPDEVVGNGLVRWDPDPHAKSLYEEIFGSREFAEPLSTPKREVGMLAQRLTKLLPEFVPDSGDPESYLRTTLDFIEQTALQNFPHEILGSLRKALGIGTPTGCVLDGCLDQAKESARTILREQGRSEVEIRREMNVRNPMVAEYLVVKLIRAVINSFSRRETAFEVREKLRKLEFDPHEEAIMTFMHRVQVIRHQARVKGITLDDTYLGQEIAEAMPEMVPTRSGGNFQLRGEMRTFAQDNPMANEAILSTRLRQLVKHFGLKVAVDQSDEIPTKPRIRQVGAKRGKDEGRTREKRFPARNPVTPEQADEILSGQEDLTERPCAICSKYNPSVKMRHSADRCWDNPANAKDKPHWLQTKKPRPTIRSIRIGSVGGSGNELRVELGEDLHALVDTGATVSLIQPNAKGKVEVLSEKEFREKLYLADGKTFMTATEKIRARVKDVNGVETEMEFIVTPDIQEEAIIGMDVLGKETGFAILPESKRLQMGKVEFLLTEGKREREIRQIDPEDPLRGEEEYGVPPLPETRKERDHRKKTWKTALDHDPRQDPNYQETSDERLGVIWTELQVESHPKSIGLSNRMKKRLRRVLKKYGHVFRDKVCPIDPRFGTHKIVLKAGTHPRSSRQYRLKPKQREAVIEFVDKMTKAGLIRDAASPWNSPLLAVPKSDGTDRICFDARKLNEGTVKDEYPVSNANECLRRLKGSTVFSIGDLLSGYWQIRMDEDSIYLTAFSSPHGQHEHLVMPMGLVNAVNTFCRVMNNVGEDLIQLFLVTYIDDWMINFRPQEDGEEGRDPLEVHLEQIEAWLSKLSRAGLALKAKKTKLLLSEVTFLGHVINAEGMHMDPAKIQKILKAPLPNSKTAVRGWLGLVNFYRQYIKNISKTLAPLYDLTVKEGPEKLTIAPDSPAAEAMKTIKEVLTSEPIVLAHPDFEKLFTIETDGSVEGLGAVLTQEGRVIEYASRRLTKAESNYTTRELECLALLFGVRKFHHYLGTRFTAVVDHKNLLNLQSYVKHNRRLARWAVALSEYDIQLEYRKGKEHVPADFMSRLPSYGEGKALEGGNSYGEDKTPEGENLHLRRFWVAEKTEDPSENEENREEKEDEDKPKQIIRVVTRAQRKKEVQDPSRPPMAEKEKSIEVTTVEQPITEIEIVQAQKECKAAQEILADLEIENESERKLRWSYLYGKRGNMLVYQGIRTPGDPESELANRIYIPENLRHRLMWHFHNHALGGHRGHEAMYFDICQRFYWNGMYADVKAYVRNCQPCRQAKATQTSRRDRLKRSINRVPFSVLFVDHVEVPAENPFGYTHILTMMDGFTKFLIAEPVTGTDAWKTEAVVWDRVVCALGRIPEVIVCDNGFDSVEWRKFCSDLGATPSLTAPYNPRANSVERPHRFLKALFRINAQAMGQQSWPMLVQTEVRAYNSLATESKLSPFEVLMGYQPETPIERILFPARKVWENWEAETHFSQLVFHLRNQRGKHTNRMVKVADADIEKAVRDPKRFSAKIEAGDLVLMQQTKMGSRVAGTATKLFMQNTGPHKVIKRIAGSDMFEIELGDSKIKRKVQGERLWKLPPSCREPFPHRMHWVLEGSKDQSGWIVVAHHNIGDVVAFQPIEGKRFQGLNIQLGVIVAIRLQEEEKPITVHLMGIQTANLKDQHAHRRKWHLIMVKDGVETVTPGITKRSTRQKTAGRVTANIDYKDMLRIPPIQLNPDGSLSAQSCDAVRKEMKARKEKGEDGKDQKKWFRAIRTEEPMKKKRKIEKERKWEQVPRGEKLRCLELATAELKAEMKNLNDRIRLSKEWKKF